jgi:hypothetical protein
MAYPSNQEVRQVTTIPIMKWRSKLASGKEFLSSSLLGRHILYVYTLQLSEPLQSQAVCFDRAFDFSPRFAVAAQIDYRT